MEWTRTSAPSIVNACECGSDKVEVRPDGLVKLYRCAECHTSLGDLTMGREP
jgi:predicted SprT family Zn-dependent metalloprotease